MVSFSGAFDFSLRVFKKFTSEKLKSGTAKDGRSQH